jgi:hypothetical protein
MSLPTITFDCDGVFANFTEKFTGFVNSFFETHYSPDWPTVYPAEAGPASDVAAWKQEHWLKGWELVDQAPFFWGSLNAYDNLPFRKIETMMNEGVIVGYFVSHRTDTSAAGSDARLMTRIWLENHGIMSAQGIIVGALDRIDLLRALQSDAHLDDIGEQVLKLRAANLNAYLLDRSWNQHIVIDPHYRVQTVDEFLVKAIAPLLPDHARDTFFSPTQQTDLVHIPDTLSREMIAEAIRTRPFRFSDLAEIAQQPRPA